MSPSAAIRGAASVATRHRWSALAASCAVGLALRAYPLHVPYAHPDQGLIPSMALHAFADGHWRPSWLVYPSGLMTLLRAAYAAAYGVGLATGRYADRIDLVGDYVRAPYPFLLVARIVACACGVATIAFVWALARRADGERAANVAALLMAVCFLHVRESHYGTPDVPGTAWWTAALVGATTLAGNPSGSIATWTGIAAGTATAFRYQLGGVVLAVPVALALAGASPRRAARCLAVAAIAALAAFTLLSPYAVFDVQRAVRDVHAQLVLSYQPHVFASLSVPTLLSLAVGMPALAMATIGALVLAWRRPGVGVTLAAGVLPYAVPLGVADRVYARYLVPLTPVVAVLAAVGLVACIRRIPTRWQLGATCVGIVLLAIDPASRSVALDRLLARPDTREDAAAWLRERVPPGDTVVVVADGWYTAPALPPGVARVARDFGRSTALAIAARAAPGIRTADYLLDGTGLDPANPPGRWIVTSEHSALPMFGLVPPNVASFVAAHAKNVAEFVGYAPAGAPGTFDPIDANFVPLADFAAQRRPGPNITVWAVEDPAR